MSPKNKSSQLTRLLLKLTLLLVVLVSAAFYLFQKQEPSVLSLASEKQRIAITQIVPHPSLDNIRQGIIDTLKEAGITDAQILYENALGNVATATQIATKFVSEKPAVIVPITTPSTQAVYAAAKGADISVIFSAVSDPVGAKLVPGDNITGVSDAAPVADQVKLIQEILPNLKRLGVIYNPGEANSVLMVAVLEGICKKQGIELLRSVAPTTTEVVTAAKALVDRVDAIYIPNDNSVASALASVLQISQTHKIPVFPSDPESVERGCLATRAPDQYEIGRQTGRMVLRYLKGTTIQQMPYETAQKQDLVINLETAKSLGLKIPQALIDRATRVYEVSAKVPAQEAQVGIIQVIEHPALDQTRAGILAALKKNGFSAVQWQSAQGNPTMALQIAQQYVGQRVRVLTAIGTTPSQMALTASKGTSIPVVFASVTDPMGAKLLETDRQVVGVSNFVPIEPQLDLFKKLLGKDRLKIGLIYNPGEANSVSIVEKTREVVKARNDVEFVFVTASKTSDVAQAAEKIVSDVDAILINNDNTALAAFDAVVKVAKERKIPVFCSDVDMIAKGALAVLGPDQYEIGLQAGEMIVRLLKSEVIAKDQAVAYPRKIETHINLDMAAALEIKIPDQIVATADQVFQKGVAAKPQKKATVAITQFIEHPALDTEREAIIKTLREAGFEEGKNLTLIYQNAQGNMATAAQIAGQIVSQKPDLVVAISTPSAQSMLREVIKHNIPLVFTAVTDPVGAKLVDNLDQKRSNSLITGVSDFLPVQEQINFVRKILPQLNNLGIVYNPGEANSVVQVKEMRVAAEKLGITLVLAPVSKTADVKTATESLIGKVEAILVPNDNTAVAAIESAVGVAERNKVPLFAADFGSFTRGVMAVVGYDRQKLGNQAGEIVIKILNGTPAGEIPVQHQHPVEILVNTAVAQKIGLVISNQVNAKVVS